MREANDRGYRCVIVSDATESYFPEFKRAALDMLTAQGAIVGWSSTSALLLAALPPALS
jgi:nicotinamidase-related amidase